MSAEVQKSSRRWRHIFGQLDEHGAVIGVGTVNRVARAGNKESAGHADAFAFGKLAFFLIPLGVLSLKSEKISKYFLNNYNRFKTILEKQESGQAGRFAYGMSARRLFQILQR